MKDPILQGEGSERIWSITTTGFQVKKVFATVGSIGKHFLLMLLINDKRRDCDDDILLAMKDRTLMIMHLNCSVVSVQRC